VCVLTVGVCVVCVRCCPSLPEQRQCPQCGTFKEQQRFHGASCRECYNESHPPHPASAPPSSPHPSLTSLEQVGTNASHLLSALPPHSHHRAPLVHFLSAGLDSTTAASLLHTSASYVRQCKRNDYSDSDLLQDKYARDVKRQKTAPSVIQELMEYIINACPTKSGSRHQTFRQYITDDALYQGYLTSVAAPVSFNTFMRIKQWLRVKHAGKYFGMFDCRSCFRLQQLPSLIHAETNFAEQLKLRLELAECKKHEETHFRSAVSTC